MKAFDALLIRYDSDFSSLSALQWLPLLNQTACVTLRKACVGGHTTLTPHCSGLYDATVSLLSRRLRVLSYSLRAGTLISNVHEMKLKVLPTKYPHNKTSKFSNDE